MESLDELGIAHRDHEAGRDALPRVLADLQVGPTRFMERRVRILCFLCFLL